MLNFRAKQLQNRWTTYQRQVLCCLYRFFNGDPTTVAKIFSTIFETDLIQCGFTTGIPYRTLNTQWVDLRRKASPIWRGVHVETPFSRNGQWSDIIAIIQATAQSLGVSLQQRQADIDVSRFAHTVNGNVSGPSVSYPYHCSLLILYHSDLLS